MKRLVLAALLLAGCQSTPYTKPEFRALDVLTLEAPDTAKAGQPVTIKVSARKLDACWEGATLGAQVDEATKTVSVIVTEQRTKPEPCAQAITWVDAQGTFTPASAGTYTIKLKVLAGKETNDRKDFEKAIAVSS